MRPGFLPSGIMDFLPLPEPRRTKQWSAPFFPLRWKRHGQRFMLKIRKRKIDDRDELSKQCFLVVEDDEAMRTLLLNRLQRRGHMVFCVDTCTEGLEEYAQLHDIITTVLMDVGLRDTSGYECYRKMLAVNPQARIIFMSGQDEMIPAEIAGNTVFLQKPFTMDQLETAVRDVHI